MIETLNFYIIWSILRKRGTEVLGKLMVLSFIFIILYQLVLIDYAAFSLRLYRVGVIVKDLCMGYVISYLFYFVSFITSFELEVISSRQIIVIRLEALSEEFNNLCIRLTGLDDLMNRS